MSFLSERSTAEKAGAFIGVMILALVVRSFWAGGIEEYFNPKKQIENQLVEVLQEDPGRLALMRTMEQQFPQDYDQFIEDMTDAVDRGGDAAQVYEAGNVFLARFLDRHRNDFASAPIGALETALRAERAALTALAKDSGLACDDYLTGAGRHGDPVSAEAAKLVGDAVAARVRAMAAGRREPQMRLPETPSDISALAQAMTGAGASRTQVEAAIAGTVRDLDPAESCDGVIRLLDGIDAQPESRKAVLIGVFLR